MSFETVERLKRDFTDKWVTVDAGTPELKRFVGLSGRVKTVNMNGRALVQFDNPVDISWYDIDLSYLKVIDAPAPKKTAEKHAEPAAKKPAAPVPAATAAGPAAPGAPKKSPIEIMREAAAAKAAAAAGGGAAAPAPAADKPLSKIEQARLQGAQKAKPTEAAAAPAPAAPVAAAEPAPTPAAAPPPAPAPAAPAAMVGEDGKPLSKLEMARRQGAQKKQ